MTMQGLRWLLATLIICLVDEIACQLLDSTEGTFDENLFEKFQVYWNVPSEVCHKYNITFDELYNKFYVLQNSNDDFRGDKIVILYDPGSFPTLKDDYDQDMERNGGIPQKGNLTLHLEEFQRSVNKLIPDDNFSGLAVIDFEMWRPIFRQLWGKYDIYRDLSIRTEQNNHPNWSYREIYEEASKVFEKSAKDFMEGTIEFAKRIRPYASWGYYDFPFCNNWSWSNKHDHCPDTIMKENDRMSWLFDTIDLFMPSVYLNPNSNIDQKIGIIRGRVKEAVRLASKRSDKDKVKVLPYYWYRYRKNDILIEESELNNTLYEIARNGGDGVIIWGMRDDIDTEVKCKKLSDYIQETLGPIILNIKYSLLNNI